MDGDSRATEILRVLDTLAGMVDRYNEVRRHGKDIGRRESKYILLGPENHTSIAPRDYSTTLLNAIKVISDDILDNAKNNIERAGKRFADAISNILNTPQQLDQEKDIARAEVCAMLALIKANNQEELPDEYCEEKWFEYRCEKVGP